MSTCIEHSQLRGLKELYEILSLFPGSVVKTNFGISQWPSVDIFRWTSCVNPSFLKCEEHEIYRSPSLKNYKFVTPLPADRYVSAFFLINSSSIAVTKKGLFTGVVRRFSQ